MAKEPRTTLSGKEARYILLRNHINQSWLSEKLGIKPQSLTSRLNAAVFKVGYQMEINKVTGKRIFDIDADVPEVKNDANRVPIIDLRQIAEINLLSIEEIIKSGDIQPNEFVAISGLNGCVGIVVYGDGMAHEYKSGDTIFIRQESDKDNIAYGRPYLIITKTDRLFKCVYQSTKNNDSLRLVSLNEEVNAHNDRLYPDREITKESIQFLYRVEGLFRREQM